MNQRKAVQQVLRTIEERSYDTTALLGRHSRDG